MHTKPMRLLAVAVLGVAVTACQDLDVVNENLPETKRALREAADVEQVLRSAYAIWRGFNGTDNSDYYPIVASEIAATLVMRQHQPSFEPRQVLRNDPVADEVWIPRSAWDRNHSALANAVDGLRRITVDGMKIMTLDPGAATVADNTARARIWGKLWAGVALGYAGLTFDRSPLYTWEMALPRGYESMIAFEVAQLRPYKEILPAAVGLLEEAIRDLDASPAFTIPASWTAGDPQLSSAQLRQLAHTMIARLLVYGPRTPQERAAVNWQKVVQHTRQGLMYDFGPTLAAGIITNAYWANIQHSNGIRRAHPSIIGPADVSGRWQQWLRTPLEQRDRFDIVTPDRRVTGATPTARGAYFRHLVHSNGQEAARGTYNFSAYQWHRNNGANNSGQWRIVSADENRLLLAEALVRLGGAAGLQEAATLVNASRTRSVSIPGVAAPQPGLPPVTAAGVTESPTCVPRTPAGACGTLMDAIIYEREIELFGQDPFRTWMDRRGLGRLVPGTVLHMPIPARYLVSMGLPLYQFGGVNGEGAAR